MIKFYRSVIIFLSFISIVSVLGTKEHIPNNLILLPLIFLCLFLIFPSFSRYMFNNLGITVLNFTMLLRYIVSPLLMSIYGSNIQIGTPIGLSTQSHAIYLMIYEMIILFMIFGIFHKYFYSNKVEFDNVKSKSNLFGWLFVILVLALALRDPSSIGRYSFIWSASQLNNDELANVSLVALLVQLAQIVLTIGILNIVYKFYEKRPNIFYLFVSLIIIMISASFIVGTSRSSIIIPLITGLFTIYILYKNYRKIITALSSVLVLLIEIVSTLLKQSTNIVTGRGLYHSAGTLENFNTDIQIYFSGLSNIAHSVETSHIYEPFSYYAILGDLTHSVVFINQYFTNFQSAIESFNNMFYKRVGMNDQILPLLGQGYLYFGPILAPIFSVITLFIVMLLDKNIYKSTSVFSLYVYAYLCVKFSLFFMSNATILLSFFTNFFLVLLVIKLLNQKIIIKRRK